MQKIKMIFQSLKRPRYFIPAIIILFILFLVARGIFGGKSNSKLVTIVAEKTTVAQEVSATGNVKADTEVNLGFGNSGIISRVYADVGEKVMRGQVLAVLDISELSADLKKAQSNLSLELAQMQNASVNLEQVTAQQNTLVANALRKLYSDDLVVEPDSQNIANNPVISGNYNGNVAGDYYISFHNTSFSNIDYAGIENGITDFAVSPKPLGTNGLLLAFPLGTSGYTVSDSWVLHIPNKSGANYTANLNAYNAALKTRDEAISSAQADLDSDATGVSISQAQIDSARAEIDSIKAKIADSKIISPISGVITEVDAKVGQYATPGNALISAISSGDLEVEVYIPEADIAKVAIGAPATVTFDAYGKDFVVLSKVFSVDPAADILEGVPTYRTVLHFDSLDSKIKSGMTANITIKGEEKNDVIAVPQRAVIQNDNGKFVQVLVGKKVIEKAVTTGLRGSDGNIEISSGLKVGDVVVTSNLAN